MANTPEAPRTPGEPLDEESGIRLCPDGRHEIVNLMAPPFCGGTPAIERAEDDAFKQLVDQAFAARPKSFQETLDLIENGWPTHLPPMPVDPKALEAARALTQPTLGIPAWVPCPDCDNFLCTIHGGHAHACACPELEFWDSELGLNPYEQGGHLSAGELEDLKTKHGYVEE